MRRSLARVSLIATAFLCLVRSITAYEGPYTADANTLHLWHFDEADPGPALDTGSGTAVSLTPENGSTLGSTDAYAGFGTAADTTDNDYSGLRSSVNVDFSAISGGDGAFTIEALIRTSLIGGVQQIVCMDSGTSGSSRVFQFKIAYSKLSFIMVNGGTQEVKPVIPAAGPHAFVAGEWFHVAVTYNGNEGEADNIKFYWTKVSESVTEANLIGQGSFTSDPGGSYELTVGKFGRNNVNNNVEGQIDEVRISDIARDPDDMTGGVAVSRGTLFTFS